MKTKKVRKSLLELFQKLSAEEKSFKVGTHDGRFHLDDAMCIAMLKVLADLFGIKMDKPIRSRDANVLDRCDIVFDVGSVYDRRSMKFDHHQACGAGKREKSGYSYSAIGLLWKEFGEEFCLAITKKFLDPRAHQSAIENVHQIAKMVDRQLIVGICATDTGEAKLDNKPNIQSLSAVVSKLNGNWLSTFPKSLEKILYDVVVPLLSLALQNYVLEAAEIIYSTPKVHEQIHEVGAEFPLLILPVPTQAWKGIVRQRANIKLIVQPNDSNDGTWSVVAVTDDGGPRTRFPAEWGGLSSEELGLVTGIKGAIFCHTGGHYTCASSREDAIKLALYSIELDEEKSSLSKTVS